MCYIFNLFRPISKHEQKYDHLTKKTNSCLLENNGKVLGNDEAEVNNQMSRKCKEENIMSYLKRFRFFSGIMSYLKRFRFFSGFDGDTEGGIQCFDVQS